MTAISEVQVLVLMACHSRFAREGREPGVQGKARSAAIAVAIASIRNAALCVVHAASTVELAVTGH